MRDWWLRTLLVLQRPRPVFVALRDDSKEASGDLAEPVLLVVWLSGIVAVLAGAATYLNDGSRDGVDLALWAFLGGGIVGAFAYFVLGGCLHGAVRLLGSQGSYRRSRHVIAFASVPVALSLVVLWPVKLALYGEDWFRTGGRDTGAGGGVFDLLTYAFVLWGLWLVVVGVRAVHGWSWWRALGATALTGFVLAAFVTLWVLLTAV